MSDPAAWDQVRQTLARRLGADHCRIYVRDRRAKAQASTPACATAPLPETGVQYGALDHLCDSTPEDELCANDYRQLQADLLNDDTHHVSILLTRCIHRSPFTDEQRAAFEDIVPALQVAAEAGRRDCAVRPLIRDARCLAETLDLASLVLDRDRRAHVLNDKVPDQLQQGSLVRLNDHGLEIPSRVSGRARLHTLLGEALSDDTGFRHGACVLRDAESGQVLVLRLARLVAPPTMFAGAVPLALVLLRTPETSSPPPASELKTGLGLTPAEASVARHLQRGRTVADIARRRGTDRETVRTQLKAIFSKTGTGGQSDLMRMLQRLS